MSRGRELKEKGIEMEVQRRDSEGSVFMTVKERLSEQMEESAKEEKIQRWEYCKTEKKREHRERKLDKHLIFSGVIDTLTPLFPFLGSSCLQQKFFMVLKCCLCG